MPCLTSHKTNAETLNTYNNLSKYLAELSLRIGLTALENGPKLALPIHVLFALLRCEGKQELKKGNNFKDNCKLFKILWLNFLSSSVVLRMNSFEGIIFFTDVYFFLFCLLFKVFVGYFRVTFVMGLLLRLKYEDLGLPTNLKEKWRDWKREHRVIWNKWWKWQWELHV